MIVQYSDNVLMCFFKVAAVLSIYGVFSATLLFFLGAFLMFLYVHRKLFSSQIHDDEGSFQEYSYNAPYEDQSYDSFAILHNRYFSLLKSLFYFYSFLWFLTYFGVSKALYLYVLFSLLVYLYLYARRDFRGYERSYLNRISLLDPRPGFFVPSDLSGGNIDDSFVFKFLEDFETRPFLDTRFQTLQPPKSLNSYGNTNAFNVALSKDLHFLSKILYYYADIYIYNSIHNFWTAVSNASPVALDRQVFKDPGSYLESIRMRFYPSEHFNLIGIPNGIPTATYIKSQAFLFNTIKDVYRSTALQSFSDSLYLRHLQDPFFRLGVAVSANTSCFPHYKEHLGFSEFRHFLEDFLLSPARLELLLQDVREGSKADETLLRDVASNFNLKVKGSVFGMFPEPYYFKWLSYYLSFFLTETSLNFRFKNILIPEHWYNLTSLYRYKRKPGRTRAGLYFSRLGTGQVRYNTDHTYKRGILEFIFNSRMYPVNIRSRYYYYMNGFTKFNILDSFDFVSLVLEPFFMYPARAYLSYVRSRKEALDILGLRRPLKVFEVKDIIRKSGDGMEPFLSMNYFMCTNNVSFVNDLGGVVCNDVSDRYSIADDLHSNALPIFSSLANNSAMMVFRNLGLKSERLTNALLSVDPNWTALKRSIESNPTFKVYLKNLIYNKYSSEFYEWFASRNSSKPFFQLYGLSLDLFIKSPNLLKVVVNREVELSSLLGTNLSITFGNYRRLLNRTGLKSSFSYKKLFESGSEPLKFQLNKIRRSKASGVPATSLPQYKKSYICFKQLKPVNLGAATSPLSTLKLLNFELLSRRAERSKLRVLLRDPFLFFSKNRKVSKDRLFRRFLWSNIFLKSAIAAASGAAVSASGNYPRDLSTFLLKSLSPWFRDKYGFSQSYINYIFSDLTIFRDYISFLYKGSGLPENVGLWFDISRNQFDVSLWKTYLDSIFSDNRFYSYSISKGHSPALALSNLLLDGEASMNLLFRIKGSYISQFPTKYMNFMAVRSSEGSMSFGRSTWKLFIATLNALVYLLMKSVLGEGRVGFGKPLDNFFILLEQLKWDLKSYNYITKHLFLTLDPLLDFKSIPDITPAEGAVGSVLYSADGVRGVNWWEGAPHSTVFKALEHVLQSGLNGDSVVDKYCFGRYMTSFWDDSSKSAFVISLKRLSSVGLPASYLLKIFDTTATRASTALAIIGSPLNDGLKNIAYSIFLNEFRSQDNGYTEPVRRYNNSIWGLDSFYGFKGLSNFVFGARTTDSFSAESYLSDARFFYTETMPSMISVFQIPATPRPRLGTFKHTGLLSMDSLNNVLRSSWYYSLFTRKPSFHHERLSLSILKGGDYMFLSNPSVNIKFSRISFLYFVLYWSLKQLGLFFRVTTRYSVKHYHFDCAFDPLNNRF